MREFNLPRAVVDAVSRLKSIEDLRTLFDNLFSAVPDTGSQDGNSDYGLKRSGEKYRTEINERCRRILEKIGNGDSTDTLTQEDIDTLKQYSGKGGLAENSQYEYYTPTHIAEGVWDIMKANGYVNGNVLDPCTGAGVFSATKPSGTVITGCDLDPVSSRIAQILNPSDMISTAPFEEIVVNSPDNSFDCAIGNVPFGDARGASAHIDPDYKNEKRIDRYFILRALDKVRPNGLVCFICPTNIVQNKGKRWEEFRRAVSEKAEFLGAHKLPSKTFAAQGTNAVTDIVVLKKHPAELLERIQNKELAPDVLSEANVYWDPFIRGKWWDGEGKRFIHGTFEAKDPKKFRDSDKVHQTVDNETLKKELAVKFHSRIDWDMLDAEPGTVRTYAEGDTLFINGAQHVFQNGSWERVVTDNSTVSLDKNTFGAESVEELKGLCADCQALLGLSFSQASAIREAYTDLLPAPVRQGIDFALEQDIECQEQVFRGSVIGHLIAKMGHDEEQGKEVTETRDRLQSLVTAEIEKFGNPKKVKKLRLAGDKGKAFGVFVNAVDKDGNFSDLLKGTLDRSDNQKYDDKDPEDIIRYLSLQRGDTQIEIEDVQALYKGDLKLEDLADFAIYDNVAIDPASGLLSPMSVYCSGDIYPKLAECRQVLASTDNPRLRDKLQQQIDSITSRMTLTKAEDISFSMRNRWFDRKYVIEYLKENGYPYARYGYYEEYEEEGYDGKLEKQTRFVEDTTAENGIYEIGDANSFAKQLEKYLNGKKITSSKGEYIQEYKSQAKDLEEGFNGWMQQSPDITELESLYNMKFNGYLPAQYDNSSLGIEDLLSGEIIPHGYQNEEVRRLSDLGCGICGFGTGLGKSFTALSLAAYNLKKSRFKRTCIVVPAAVLENWYHEARQLYSEDFMNNKVFFVGLEPKREKDGTITRKNILDENGQPRIGKNGKPVMQDVVRITNSKDDIFRQMWAIPQSNYSIVVMTKEKFASIPIDRDLVSEYANDMVHRRVIRDTDAKKLQDAYDPDKKKGGKKKSYNEDKRETKLQQQFTDTGRKKEGNLPSIDALGFDNIITDETHFFKNSLEGGENTQGIVYIPNAPSSQIARDMAIKSYYIRKKNGGKGVYGLTATPVTNSPLEIFNMLSMIIDPQEFKDRGIDTPDRFVTFFADIQSISKTMLDGDIADKDAVVGFKELDALRGIFHKYCNIKTVDDVDKEIHVPNKTEHNESVEISQAQKAKYEILRKVAKEATRRDSPIPVFSVIRDMDRVSTDMDMFYHTITFTLDAKYSEQVKKAVVRIEDSVTSDEEHSFIEDNKFDFKQGNGLMESDELPEAVSLKEENNIITVTVHDYLESRAIEAFRAEGILDANGKVDVGHPIPPKYARLISNIEKYFKGDFKGKQIIFTDEKSQHQKLARILERNVNGLEPGRIGIINAEDAKGTELDRIGKAFNSGELWIVIANKKAEVGVNLQKGTVAIHHLTLPWTPASINQRNGRGVRQGNKMPNVDVYYYCGTGTFDEYRATTLKGKANWIGQLLNGKEAKAENADAASVDEMAIMLADNPEEARKLIEEQKAKKAAETKLRRERLLGRTLGQYLKAKKALENFEVNTSMKMDEFNDSLTDMTRQLEGYKQALASNPIYAEGTSERVRLLKDISKLEQKIFGVQNQQKRYSEKRVKDKQNYEATLKRAKGTILNAQKSGEKLPFDFEAVTADPSSCYISTIGDVFKAGDYVMLPNKSKYAPYQGEVFQISIENYAASPLRLTALGSGRRVHLPATCYVDFIKIALSEEEKIEKKLLSSGVTYRDIVESGVSKEHFYKILGRIKYQNDYEYTLVENKNGEMIYVPYTDRPEGYNLTYPDKSNPEWRKRALMAYIQATRKSRLTSSYSMIEIFGDEFTKALKEVMDVPTDTEANQICVDAFNRVKELKVASSKSMFGPLAHASYMQVLEHIIKNNSGFRSSYNQQVQNILRERTFDGFSEESQNVSSSVYTQMFAELQKEYETLKNQKEEEEIKNSMIDAKLYRELQEKGIKLFLNPEKFSTYFKGRTTDFPAQAVYLITDSAGFNGRLYKVKNTLKSDYQAKYTKEYPADMGTSYWIVSKDKITPEEIRNLLLG